MSTSLTKSSGPKGEIGVWFTSMGLSVGLLLVVALLLLVIYHGTAVFWPKRIVELQLSADNEAKILGSDKMAGEVVLERHKLSRSVEANKEVEEWQLFVGNKDVYGFSFRFVDRDAISKISEPPDFVKIERLEYGHAIGTPKALLIGEQEILATDAGFDEQFKVAVQEVKERRQRIHRIEKRDIGKINHEINKLQLRVRAIDRREQQGPIAPEMATERDALKADIAKRTEAYEALAVDAKKLRQEQDVNRLRLELVTGQTKEMSIGTIIRYHYPNRLGPGEQFALCLENIWHFISESPREANTEGGVFPAIFGTFVMTVLMSLAVTPFGVITAIYLHEYARQGLFVRLVRIAINNLAGVPSIVFGVFGLGFFVYLVGGSIDRLFFANSLPTPTFGTGGMLWCSLTLALLTVPVVIVASEEALAAVPRGTREGALAIGASKWQTIQRVVLPAAAPGILTGVILAMARGAGEVAPLMLVGVVKLAPDLPINLTFPYVHLEQKFMHLGFHIYDLGFQSPDSDAARPMVFATTLLLIGIVVLLNSVGIVIRERLRKKYAGATF